VIPAQAGDLKIARAENALLAIAEAGFVPGKVTTLPSSSSFNDQKDTSI